MCGICGYIGAAGDGVLQSMRDTLAHRGPDEAGAFFEGRVALGHRRLSIVDVAAGQQPLHSNDGAVVVVFNGEIYNHPDLKRRLESKGHVYRTDCDTESVINAYREYGEDCPRHLEGMFAFVLYDKVRNRLFGARDRFGKKPLYYSLPGTGDGRSFVFGSEIRALLRHDAVRSAAQVSEEGVRRYLLHDYLPGRHSIFANVWKLEAGHAFSLDLDSDLPQDLPRWSYWTNPIMERPTVDLDAREAAEQLLRLLEKATERRLMSDVPLGVFLSGGIDSSAIVALLSRVVPAAEIETFSIGFDEPSFDESGYARLAAEFLGTRHHSRTFTAADCRAELGTVLRHLDEPFADPSVLPTSMLCRFARERVTVALGGDGGDELFAGYDPFKALTAASAYARLVPRPLDAGVFKNLARLLPASSDNMALGFRVERFLRGAKQRPGARLPIWMGPLSPEQLSSVMPGGGTGVLDCPFAAELEQYALLRDHGADEIQAALAYFQRFYLTDDILVKADRASMMHSLEVRAPFLDTELAEFANRLPSRLKHRHGRGKYLLKRALGSGDRPLLPPAIVNRPKKGFGIPVAAWIRNELKEEFATKLLHEWPGALACIDARAVEALYTSHVTGRANNYKELWALYVLGEWARHWAT